MVGSKKFVFIQTIKAPLQFIHVSPPMSPPFSFILKFSTECSKHLSLTSKAEKRGEKRRNKKQGNTRHNRWINLQKVPRAITYLPRCCSPGLEPYPSIFVNAVNTVSYSKKGSIFNKGISVIRVVKQWKTRRCINIVCPGPSTFGGLQSPSSCDC